MQPDIGKENTSARKKDHRLGMIIIKSLRVIKILGLKGKLASFGTIIIGKLAISEGLEKLNDP